MKIIPIILGIKYGTMSQYLHLEHNPNTLYYITDKGLLYIGDELAVQPEFVDVIPKAAEKK